MRPWRLGLLTISTLVFLMPRAGFADTARGEVNQVTAYQFRGDQLAQIDGVVEGRIEYEVNGKTVHTELVSFRIESGGKATFLVPDPAHLAALGRTPATAKVWLHVYAGDVLLDSFDPAGFRAYNERLWRSDRETIERLARRPSPPITGATEKGASTETAGTLQSLPAGLELITAAIDTCTLA